MRAVALELSAHATNTGSYPATLDDLGFRLYPLFERGIPNDPWHRPYVYRAPGSAGRPYDLESTGADGVPSADDLRYEVK